MTRNSFDAIFDRMMDRTAGDKAQPEPHKKITTFDGKTHHFAPDTPDTDIERFQWRYDNGQDVSPSANVRTPQPLSNYFDKDGFHLTEQGGVANQLNYSTKPEDRAQPIQLAANITGGVQTDATPGMQGQRSAVPIPTPKPARPDYSTFPPGVEWELIGRRENISSVDPLGRVRAYWPKTDGSGITIATGFDLGRHDEKELRAMGFPQHVIDKLKPGLVRAGQVPLRGRAAEKYLEENPLYITEKESKLIDGLVATYKYRQLAGNFNRAQNLGGARFEDLPREAQTAIMDLAFQYGTTLGHRDGAPKFWRMITNGQWETAVEELRNFGDQFEPRRLEEADLLDRAIKTGKLPRLPGWLVLDASSPPKF